ncbi:MAG TPA: cytosolic protein [Candidatus Dorea intestinavium]|nr:cytosolic protein [Candidatus Dorea intestinavium]
MCEKDLEIADNQEMLAKMVMDMLHRTIVHHVFWFKEVEHQMGFERALEVMDSVYDQSMGLQLKRLGKILNFDVVNGIPAPLLNLPEEKLSTLVENIGLNWLAADGIWFQAVEREYGMNEAKRCNDSCWAWFSPFEAWSIMRMHNIEPNSGLVGLKKALEFRLYAKINTQTIIEESDNSLVLQMNNCRVQAARKRKNMEDYPCKSAGLVEYTNFARSIDSRIKTECIACPPDKHPEDWYCSWRFTI